MSLALKTLKQLLALVEFVLLGIAPGRSSQHAQKNRELTLMVGSAIVFVCATADCLDFAREGAFVPLPGCVPTAPAPELPFAVETAYFLFI